MTGAGGFVGSFACERLGHNHSVSGTGRKEGEHIDYVADITDAMAVEKMIKDASPDVVVHCAKIDKSVDYCEEKKDECYKVNTLGTMNLVDSVSRNAPDCKFIFLSTDYVYDGMRGGYTEKDPVNPVDYYGVSKLMAENYVAKLSDHLILRTTVVFGWHPRGANFFMQLLGRQEKKESMLVPLDQESNPTYVHLLTDVIERGIEKGLKGVYIATGPEALTRYDFALKIADKMGFDKELIKPVWTSELKQKAARPLNCSTIPKKLQKDLGHKFPSLDESLEHLKKEVESRRR